MKRRWTLREVVAVAGAVATAAACESLGGLSQSEDAGAADGSSDAGGADAPGIDDASGNDAGDAGAGGDAATKGIRCGPMRCAVGDACCAARDAGTFACKAAADCFDTTFRCEKTADCTAAGFPDGTQCCGQWTGTSCGMTKSACGSCPVTNGMMCDPDLPFACGDAAACVPLQCWPNTYYVCQ